MERPASTPSSEGGKYAVGASGSPGSCAPRSWWGRIDVADRGPRSGTTGPRRHRIWLHRRFTTPQPDQLWVADITYVRTGSGWLYLAVVLDAFSADSGPNRSPILVISDHPFRADSDHRF
jgi:hypothetical protein